MLIGRLIHKVIGSNLVLSPNPATALLSAGKMLRETCGNDRYGRLLNYRQVDGKYYWHPHLPGYPSPAFDRFLRHRIECNADPALYAAYVVITSACPLNCEHCFEHDAVTSNETRSEEEVLDSITQLINLGTTRIALTGGEPLTRLPLIHCILQHFSNHEVQFWINTSAAGLTTTRIRELKSSGLTGITFSLDHHDEHAHDRFRGREGCYRQVISSVKTAVELGLVTELSLCATNDFVSEENLTTYLRLASDLGVPFVQILEPRSIGKYEGRNVALKPDKRKLLESFCRRKSTSRNGTEKPLINYPDYHNRRYGCDGGKYHIYIDMFGNAFPCPFCKSCSASLDDLNRSNLSRRLRCPHSGGQSPACL